MDSKSLAQSFRKFTLYFRAIDEYWRLVLPGASGALGSLGVYPLDFARILASGHFSHVDETGLPIEPAGTRAGFVRNYSGLCGFALAHWQLFLLTNDEEHRRKLLDVADYILATAERDSTGLKLRMDVGGGRHVGHVSVLSSGQAISVLCRAWQTTMNEEYLAAAIASVEPYAIPVQKGGLMSRMDESGAVWFEEVPGDPRLSCILNGMIFGLWGLAELAETSGYQIARDLFETGVDSLASTISRFDAGYWSYYCLPKQGSFVASMNYHCLHIFQLIALSHQTRHKEFLAYAERFRAYCARPLGRLHAGASLLRWKCLGKIHPPPRQDFAMADQQPVVRNCSDEL